MHPTPDNKKNLDQVQSKPTPIDRLVELVKVLRSPNGCPWDKEQTLQTLIPHIKEELYELIDAIEQNDPAQIKDELGDAFLHVIMLAQFCAEDKWFSLQDVAEHETDKMIHRHPHVFGDTVADTVDDVWQNWEKIKNKSQPDSILQTIPKSMPTLIQSEKIQKKVARIGFDWANATDAFQKLREELIELEHHAPSEDTPPTDAMIEEAGDVLFSTINYLRKLGISGEAALSAANKKFRSRFTQMEQWAKSDNQDIEAMSLDQLEGLWNRAKAS